MLERMKGLIAEEVQAVLPSRGFPNQFESRDGWKVLQPTQKMVGRVFTVQFMPLRGDIAEVDEAEAKAKGKSAARNQTAIDQLGPGDVIVADVFGADWNFVGNKLAHYIQTTTKNGMIVTAASTGWSASRKPACRRIQEFVSDAGHAGNGDRHQHSSAYWQNPGDAGRRGPRRPRRHVVHPAAHGEERGRVGGDVEGARRLEPDDAGYREVHLTPDARTADAGAQKEREEYIFKKTGRKPTQRDQ